VLVANLAHLHVEDTDWDYSEFSLYDLGQAVAHMTIQAQALGLSARQFRAFDRDALAAEFAVPAHWQVTTITAFGVALGGPAQPSNPDEGAARERERNPLGDVLWPGG
jgi:hypothetical protein